MKDALGRVGTVLVLGGTSDIGVATARELVERGCRTVLLAGRDLAALETRAGELRGAGAERVEVLRFDAAEPASHAAVVQQARELAGDLDVVLLAVGLLGDQGAMERDPAAAVAVATTNYTGAVSICLTLAPVLQAQGHGTLVVLSSVAAVRARRANYVYGSSKAGLDAFAQGLGDALHGSGARVLLVRPGFVHSAMTRGLPAAPLSTTPEAVARAVVGALAADRSTVWVPRAVGPLMTALSLLPRPLWRRLPG